MKKLIGIDLDGTLLNSKQLISQRNIETLLSIPEQFMVFICSGREVHDIKNILNEYNLSIPAIGSNGAVGYNGENKLFEFSFKQDYIRSLHEILKDYPIKFYTSKGSFQSLNYVQHLIELFNSVGQEFSQKELEYELAYEQSVISTHFENIEEILSIDGILIYKIFVFIPNSFIKQALVNQLKVLDDITMTESSAVNLEIVPPFVSKGYVFDHLERIYQLNRNERFAIGDSLNDVSLFEKADITFAMKNGHPQLLQMATHIVSSNDEDGVSEALEFIFSRSVK